MPSMGIVHARAVLAIVWCLAKSRTPPWTTLGSTLKINIDCQIPQPNWHYLNRPTKQITINYKFILNFAAYTTPFVFGVVTDANDGDPTPTDKQNRGFNLLYSQLPCATLG